MNETFPLPKDEDKEIAKHTYSAGGVIISPEGRILVVSQHGTSWSLPKGKLEKDEDHKAAALREIEEETGIKHLNFIKELGTYDRYKINESGGDDHTELKTITMYLYTTPETQLKPLDPHNPEAIWVESNKVGDLLTHQKDSEFYESVLPEVSMLIGDSKGNS